MHRHCPKLKLLKGSPFYKIFSVTGFLVVVIPKAKLFLFIVLHALFNEKMFHCPVSTFGTFA